MEHTSYKSNRHFLRFTSCKYHVVVCPKYRLQPSKSQRTKLLQTLEMCRWVYNETLATRKKAWEQEKKSVSLYDTNKMLTLWKQEHPQLRDVFSQVLQNVQERVDLAFKVFFRRVKAGEKAGYPRFRGYGWYDSFTFKQFGFELLANGLFLSQIGVVKIILHRPVGGKNKDAYHPTGRSRELVCLPGL